MNMPSRHPVYFASLIGITALIIAYISQYGFGLNPCELCWWQRYPYMIMAGVLPVTFLRGLGNNRAALGLVALLFAVGAAIAGFHTGVEQKWWEGLATCSGVADLSGDVDAALSAIMNAPIIKCDEIAWSLFGISMAGFNFILASIMTLFCVIKMGKAEY